MKIYLVRHGQSVGNENMMCYGSTDYPLTAQGLADAAAAGGKLAGAEFKVCWTSCLCRAQDTAELCCAGREVEIIPTPLINEQFMGDFEGIAFGDLLIKYPKEAYAMLKDWSVNPPLGGESFDELYDRVGKFAEMLLADGRDCLVAAHNGSLGALMTVLLGLPKKAAVSFRFDHGCYSLVRTAERGVYLERFNV